MNTDPDLTTWLSKADAAARLGMSERSLDRLVAAGKGPEMRPRQRPKYRPEPVYNPADVARLAAANHRPMLIAPESVLTPATVPKTPALARIQNADPGLAQLGAFFERVIQLSREYPAPAEKLYLTIPEASTYSGLSETFLRRMVRAGRLAAIRDRAYKIRRSDLDGITAEVDDFVSRPEKRKRG